MAIRIVVTGTDTGIGKTVFSAGLTHLLGAAYWKPVQAGTDSETDTATVRRLAQLSVDRTLPEAWVLTHPASPHLAAELDGVAIQPEHLAIPTTARPLIIEGAGGLMVPWSRQILFIDLVASWHVPIVLCARTTLGTLNHTLLSIDALRRRQIPVIGVALIGDDHPDNERTLREFAGVPILGRLPRLVPLAPDTLHSAFANAFRCQAFLDFDAA